jgi:signal peptidase II
MMLLGAAIVAVLDRFSKAWFIDHFTLGESRPLVPGIALTLVHNTGTAFGFMQNNNRLMLGVAYLVFFLLVYSARGLCERAGAWGRWGLSLVLGGALGNILDRHLYGYVVDFIDLRVWPVFNFADSAITIGALTTEIGLFMNNERTAASRA